MNASRMSWMMGVAEPETYRVESGVSRNRLTTENRRILPHKTAEVTQASGGTLESTVVLSSGAQDPAVVPDAPVPGPAGVRYAEMDTQQRREYRDLLKKMDEEGRLFVPDRKGLRRVGPAEIKERLDLRQPVVVVTREGTELRSQGSSSLHQFDKDRGVFTAMIHDHASSSDSRKTVTARYRTSEFREWDSLELMTDGPGIPGTPTLPPSGNAVTLSDEWESHWRRCHEEAWGVFTEKHRIDESSGYERRTKL